MTLRRAMWIAAPLILLSRIGWSASYITCIGVSSGDWKNASTWALSTMPSVCNAGVPGSGDTVTIPLNVTVTVSDIETVGMNSTGTGSTDLIVNGTFTVTGQFQMRGSVSLQRNSTFNLYGGIFNFLTPGQGATYSISYSSVGTGATPIFRACAEPTCLAVGSGNAILTASGGGVATINAGGSNYAPLLVLNHATLKNLGSATVASVNYAIAAGLNAIDIRHIIVASSGRFSVSLGSARNVNFQVDGLSFVNCLDTVSSRCADFTDSAPLVSGTRLFTNITAYSTGGQKGVALYVQNARLGQSRLRGDPSDVPGFQGYNVRLDTGNVNAANIIVRNTGVVMDSATNSSYTCFVTAANNGQIYQDILCYSHVPNQHEIVSIAPLGGQSNLYQGYLCDGDAYTFTDAGDMVQDLGIFTLKNSIAMNRCGTLITAGFTTETATVLGNTSYQSYGAAIGETNGTPTQITIMRDNLLTYPADNGSGATIDTDGLHHNSAFVRQSSFSLDYNAFYGMPGSGDPGAGPKGKNPGMLPNLALGGISGYIQYPQAYIGHAVYGTGGYSNVSSLCTDATHITCTSCNFLSPGGVTGSMQAGDYVLDTATKAFASISSVPDSTHVVLNLPGFPGCTGSHSYAYGLGFWSTPGYLVGDNSLVAGGLGQHDLHVNPNFLDPSRTLCTWLVSNGGYAPCGHTGHKVVTATTGTANIQCSSCRFQDWQITPNDVVAIYAPATGLFRGTAQVQSVDSQTQITIATPIIGLAVNDSVSFVTATQNLGRALVTLNGYDYTGAPTPPVTWATIGNALNYVRTGFSPQNPILKSAGSPQDGYPDLGAVSVIPATIHRRPPSHWRR